MIRFLGLFITLLGVYLSLILLKQSDSALQINFQDYSVETSVISCTLLILFALCLIQIMVKLISIIINLPVAIRNNLEFRRVSRSCDIISQSTASFLAGNKQLARLIIKKASKDLPDEHRLLHEIIKAETEDNFEIQISLLQKLSTHKNYSYYAFKRLAQIFYERKLYIQAEEYATKAYSLVETDTDILQICIYCYAELLMWNKFVNFTTKLAKSDPQLLTRISEKIASYYLVAARDSLSHGKDEAAKNYLESALELEPTFIEALDLYCTLCNNEYKKFDYKKILSTAFAAKPSFPIAELYFKFVNAPAQEMYDDLTTNIERKSHRVLLLTIASYLNLPEQIISIKTEF